MKFFVDKKAHKLFRDLVDLKGSLLYGRDLKDVFILSMAFGFRLGKKKPLEKRQEVADITVFSEQQITLIKAVAVTSEKNLEVLLDKKRIFTIAEEYANGGILLLHEMIFETKDDPTRVLDKKITSLVKK